MKQKFSWLLLLTLGLGTSPMAAEQEPTPTEMAPATESKPVEMSAPAPEAPAAEAPKGEEPVKVEEAAAPKAEEAPVEKPKKKKSRKAKKSAHKGQDSVKPCVLSPADAAQKAKQDGLATNKCAPSSTTVVAVPADGDKTTAVVVAPEATPSCSTGSCGK